MATDAIGSMLDALALEVAAVRKAGRGRSIDLRGGVLSGTEGGIPLYRFPITEDLHLRDDTPVVLEMDRSEVRGTLVSLHEGFLTVSLDKDLGPRIAAARLVVDEGFLLERLREALQKVLDGTKRFNRRAADRVIGHDSVNSQEGALPPGMSLNGLNVEQAKCVHLALGSNALFLWGPPGTGKTKTIARIIEAHYRAGRSVLLVSNTNVAVDAALEKVADSLREDPEFNAGTVLRLGVISNEGMKTKYGDKVQIDKVVQRLSTDLVQRRAEIQAKAALIEAETRPFRMTLDAFTALRTTQGRLEEESGRVLLETSRVAKLRDKVSACDASIGALRLELAGAKSAGMLRRLLTGARPERILAAMGRLELERGALMESCRAAECAASSAEESHAKTASAVARMRAALEMNDSQSDCEHRVATSDHAISELNALVGELDAQLAAIKEEVGKKCRVLAATVYQTFLSAQIDREFDVVVIDEASMLMLPLSYFAAGIARESVVVAGDFRQLPPIVQSDEPSAVEWLRKDVFEKSGVPERLPNDLPHHVTALKEQYRMREEICNCVNELFYKNTPLRTSRAETVYCGFPLGESPLVYVDTSRFHPWAAFRQGTWSRYNLFHAQVIRNIANCMRRSCRPSDADKIGSLGIVAPYASQARLIRALCREAADCADEGLGATVHTFQGSERDTIVVDLPDSFGGWLGSFMKAKEPHDPGTRLMNVALSRARNHVILVANFEYLRKKAPSEGIIPRVLDYFEEHGSSVDLEGLGLLARTSSTDGLDHVGHDIPALSTNSMSWHTEGTFYNAFSSDLRRAGRSILVFSPFLTQRGTGRWADLFRAAMARGVCVRIVTRPPGDQGGSLEHGLSETIQELRNLGAIVDLRARMHEKIAVVDGEVLWHGSLNVMSHNDTTESMFRIPSAVACQELLRLVATPAPGAAHSDGPKLGAPENPSCEACGSPMIWNTGRFGIYFTCERSGCDGKRNLRGKSREGAATRGTRTRGAPAVLNPCPSRGCGGHFVQRKGRYGAFLGCSNYPKCTRTKSVA